MLCKKVMHYRVVRKTRPPPGNILSKYRKNKELINKYSKLSTCMNYQDPVTPSNLLLVLSWSRLIVIFTFL